VLAGFAEPLQFFTPTSLAGLLIIGLAPHLLAQATPFAQLSEAANRFLNALSRTDP
jgi:hypothetical protein